MKFFQWMKEGVKNQELLYYWFLFIVLLPSLVLSWTEPMSIWVKMASVFLPMGVYMILFNLFRKPGVFLLLCFVLLLINGYQLVLIYLFGESVVSPDMFLNIVTTDAGESGELMRTIWPAVLTACVLYFSAVALGVISVMNKRKLATEFVMTTCRWALVPILLGSLLLGINASRGFSFRLNHDIYPINAFYNLDFAVRKYYKTQNHRNTSSDFTFQAHKKKSSAKREVVVLVIGETTRAANWQLWGYERATNPFLSKRKDLALYKDVLTQGNTTHKIVPMILSRACAEDFEQIYHQKSIVAAFKEAGFQTLFLSNQIPDRAFIDDFASEADVNIRISDIEKGPHHPYDNDGISFIRKYVEASEKPLFIVYHTYGTHFEYSQRFDPKYAVFKPFKAGALRYKERPVFLNAYDNAVCNVDRMLNELIQTLDREELCSSMLYLSDHGEDLMDDKRKLFLHCSPIPTYYQIHIPLVVWLSSSFKETYPQCASNIVANQSKPVSSNAVFHTMLDLGAISTPFQDSTLSLGSSSFKVRERFFIDEHDEAVSFPNLGLKKQDWDMMHKMNIRF